MRLANQRHAGAYNNGYRTESEDGSWTDSENGSWTDSGAVWGAIRIQLSGITQTPRARSCSSPAADQADGVHADRPSACVQVTRGFVAAIKVVVGPAGRASYDLDIRCPARRQCISLDPDLHVGVLNHCQYPVGQSRCSEHCVRQGCDCQLLRWLRCVLQLVFLRVLLDDQLRQRELAMRFACIEQRLAILLIAVRGVREYLLRQGYGR